MCVYLQIPGSVPLYRVGKMRASVLGLLLLSGCATADFGQLADSATTAIGLEAGFSEGNPLFHGPSWPVIASVKLGVTQVAKVLPEPYCSGALFGLTATGFGAAIWNFGVMLGSGPAALPFVGAMLFHFWEPWRMDAVQDCADVRIVLENWTGGWNDVH